MRFLASRASVVSVSREYPLQHSREPSRYTRKAITLVTETSLPHDPLWPRAAEWIVPAPADNPACDIALLGVGAHRTSITPTGAHATPSAVREALLRYSTYAASRGIDVADLTALDFGDVE